MIALVSKKNGFAGNIIHTPSKTLAILGFNFEADFTAIREEIRKNPKIYDQRILQYIQNMDVYSANDINNLYKNIRDLADFLVERMGSTRNRKRYQAYKKLYDTLMITDNVTEMFTMKNGEVANTYLEFLDDYDLTVGEFVRNADVAAIPEHIEHILFRLNVALKDLRHLYIFNDSNNVTMEAIISLIKFFKSYTTDLNSFNILYLMDSRYFNMIKMLGEVNHIEKTLGLKTNSLRTHYKDTSRTLVKLLRKQKAQLREGSHLIGKIKHKKKIKQKHSRKVSKVLKSINRQRLIDIVAMKSSLQNREDVKFDTNMNYTVAIHRKDLPTYRDARHLHLTLSKDEKINLFSNTHMLNGTLYQNESSLITNIEGKVSTNYSLNQAMLVYGRRTIDKMLNPESHITSQDLIHGQSVTMDTGQKLLDKEDYQFFKDMQLPSDTVAIKMLESLVANLQAQDKIDHYLDIVTDMKTNYSIDDKLDLTKVRTKFLNDMQARQIVPVYGRAKTHGKYATRHSIGDFLHTSDIPETTLYPTESVISDGYAKSFKDTAVVDSYSVEAKKHTASVNLSDSDKLNGIRGAYFGLELEIARKSQIKTNSLLQHSKEIASSSLAHTRNKLELSSQHQEKEHLSLDTGNLFEVSTIQKDRAPVSDNIKLTWEE